MDHMGIDLAERDKMNRIARILFMPAISMFLFTSLLETTGSAQAPRQMNIWQARRAIAAELKEWSSAWGSQNSDRGTDRDIHFTSDGFEYEMTNGKTFRIDLTTAPALVADCNSRFWCTLKDEKGQDPGRLLPKDSDLKTLLDRRWSDSRPIRCLVCDDVSHTERSDNRARTFAAAFNTLHAFAVDTKAPLRTFTERAAAWRALATKPPIPEEVRVQRLMAEDSFKANKPDEALHYYETGILLYPTWPEGNFNAALIAGDLGDYDAAIEHMQAYLDLVPEAADAQAARDKILIWQTKAKEK
jgi:tetratricopeptide (TPR) repeat protein